MKDPWINIGRMAAEVSHSASSEMEKDGLLVVVCTFYGVKGRLSKSGTEAREKEKCNCP